LWHLRTTTLLPLFWLLFLYVLLLLLLLLALQLALVLELVVAALVASDGVGASTWNAWGRLLWVFKKALEIEGAKLLLCVVLLPVLGPEVVMGAGGVVWEWELLELVRRSCTLLGNRVVSSKGEKLRDTRTR
jgi:hypothetical protein